MALIELINSYIIPKLPSEFNLDGVKKEKKASIDKILILFRSQFSVYSLGIFCKKLKLNGYHELKFHLYKYQTFFVLKFQIFDNIICIIKFTKNNERKFCEFYFFDENSQIYQITPDKFSIINSMQNKIGNIEITKQIVNDEIPYIFYHLYDTDTINNILATMQQNGGTLDKDQKLVEIELFLTQREDNLKIKEDDFLKKNQKLELRENELKETEKTLQDKYEKMWQIQLKANQENFRPRMALLDKREVELLKKEKEIIQENEKLIKQIEELKETNQEKIDENKKLINEKKKLISKFSEAQLNFDDIKTELQSHLINQIKEVIKQLKENKDSTSNPLIVDLINVLIEYLESTKYCIDKKTAEELFRDSITLDTFVDPVVISDGTIHSKSSIIDLVLKALRAHQPIINPLTRDVLTATFKDNSYYMPAYLINQLMEKLKIKDEIQKKYLKYKLKYQNAKK